MRRNLVRTSWTRCGSLISLILVSTGSAAASPGPPGHEVPATTAGGASGPVIKLTWANVLNSIDRHPRLGVGQSQIDAARSGVDVARTVPNPSLEGSIGQGFSRSDGTSRLEWGLSVSMPLGWLAQRSSRIDVASAEVDVALAQSQALRRDVVFELRTLFWNLAYEQARVKSLEAMQEQTLALVATIRRRVEAGEVRPVEATRVEVELEKVKGELGGARTARRAREAELSLWLGVPNGTTLTVEADLGNLPVIIERDAALAKARGDHPSLAVAEAQSRLMEADVHLEKAARLPTFAVTGFTTHELDRRAYGVGLAVDVPLFDWNSGRITQAEARLAASRRRAQVVSLELQGLVLNTQAACEASVSAGSRLRDAVLPRAESTASTMEKTYQLGEVSLLEVIDARRTLLDAHRQYLGVVAQAQIDCSRLQSLLGEESP